MNLFEPKRADGRSLWQVAYDYLVAGITEGRITPGTVIAHEDLAAAMGMRFVSSAYYQAVLRASRQLETDHGRTLRSVKGTGYQVVAGTAMTDAGLVHHGKSRKQMDIAIRTVNAVRVADLETLDERSMLTKVRTGLAMAGAVLAMQAERIAEHDSEIALLKSARMDDRARVKATESEVEEIKARLLALEDRTEK